MRVVIAEDLALLRDGLSRLLRDNGFEVVAAVSDGAIATSSRSRANATAVNPATKPPRSIESGVGFGLPSFARM